MSLLGEVYSGITLFRNFDQFGGVKGLEALSQENESATVDPKKLQRTGLPKTMSSRAFLARHLEFWNTFYRFAKTEDDVRVLSKKLEEMSKLEEKRIEFSYIVNQIMMPVFSQIGVACVSMSARQTCTRALLAAMQYRSVYGQFPKSLEELGGTWIDPFTKNSVKYSATEKSCTIYSVGRDLKDDGGISRISIPASERSSRTFDEVVSFPPVTGQ